MAHKKDSKDKTLIDDVLQGVGKETSEFDFSPPTKSKKATSAFDDDFP